MKSDVARVYREWRRGVPVVRMEHDGEAVVVVVRAVDVDELVETLPVLQLHGSHHVVDCLVVHGAVAHLPEQQSGGASDRLPSHSSLIREST